MGEFASPLVFKTSSRDARKNLKGPQTEERLGVALKAWGKATALEYTMQGSPARKEPKEKPHMALDMCSRQKAKEATKGGSSNSGEFRGRMFRSSNCGAAHDDTCEHV